MIIFFSQIVQPKQTNKAQQTWSLKTYTRSKSLSQYLSETIFPKVEWLWNQLNTNMLNTTATP